MIECKVETLVLYDNEGEEVDSFPARCLYEIVYDDCETIVRYFDEEKLKKLPDNASAEDIIDCIVTRRVYGMSSKIKVR